MLICLPLVLSDSKWLQVISVLKKELMRTQGNELERAGEYRRVLVQCVHKCAVKYPDVAAGVVHLLMEFLGESQSVGKHRVLLLDEHVLPAC
jgi:coatomer subunit beta